MKSGYQSLSDFLLPVIFIGCIGAIPVTSRSQPDVAAQPAAPSQATESKAGEQNGLEVVARLTVDESDAEFRVVYDREREKCILQWVEKNFDNKETTQTIFTEFTEDGCVYPYQYRAITYLTHL